ncbi:CoA-binding protein [Fodinicurvata halophila]|uniref:CoA-binding protein n=1 Tax=Fodinicurvata halophila TaxID=1419723 RepID=A0ABV8ULY1_9PROT
MTEAASHIDTQIPHILKAARTIAMVGASPKTERPSHQVMAFLQSRGHRVIPVNPGVAGQSILGEKVYASLSEIPDTFQMVDIFRNSEAAGAVVEEALPLAKEKGLETIWMQLDIRHEEAAEKARSAGLTVVMDRCPKIEYGRFQSKLS